MAKKKLRKKAVKKKTVRTHLFLGGNYAVGHTTIIKSGMLKFSLLNKTKKIGASVKNHEFAGVEDTLLFIDPRTVQVFIDHLTEMKQEMLAANLTNSGDDYIIPLSVPL